MQFNTFGNPEKPLAVFLAGSFCPAESMELVYSHLEDSCFILAPTYNGCYNNSGDFTSRQGETAEICEYIKSMGISAVKLVYAQSMGCEVGIELICQLMQAGISVEHSFFDGAPCASLSKPMREIMFWVFSGFINKLKGKTLKEAMDISLVKMMSNNDPEAFRPMLEPILAVAPYITKETIRNQVECCYTFDFPQFPAEIQNSFCFFYGQSEKAYKLCYKKIKRAYPKAKYIIKEGYGHCTYVSKHTDDYIALLKNMCNI